MKSIDDKQFKQLVAALPSTPAGRRDRVLLAVMFDGGLRCAEACALLPSDIQSAAENDYWIRVRHGKGEKKSVDGVAPAAGIGKERFVSIDFQLWSLIEGWIADPDRPTVNESPGKEGDDPGRPAFLFPVLLNRAASGNRGAAWRGSQLSTRQVRSKMKTLSQKAGVFIETRDPQNRAKTKKSWVFPHALRHSYAIRLIRGGALLPTVQEQLGHEHLTTTQRYLKFSDPERANQVRVALSLAREGDDLARQERLQQLDKEGFGLDVFERLPPAVRGTLAGAVKDLEVSELLARLGAGEST
ncbi:MAG: tyrosine-type recombinase/integrase [Thermoleophilia bacterium]|nr:tyrosine-type recombinase/integrase [Thermoleophilia bacterium]